MKKLFLAVAVLALALALPAGATTITWTPGGGTNFNAAVGPLWITPGDHTVVIPAGNYLDASTSDWGAQYVWESSGIGVADYGARQASTITFQGAGAGSTFIGSSASNESNGWNRVNAVDMSGITYSDMSIMNLASNSMFGQLNNAAPAASDITFENVALFLGNGTLVGRTNQVGGDPGSFTFTNTDMYIVNDKINAQWDAGAGLPDADYMVFDADSSIAKWDSGTYGAFSVLQIGDTGKYSTSLVTVDNLYTSVGAANEPGGDGQFTNTDVFNLEGDFFTSSTAAAGADGWTGGLPGGGGGAPIPEPSALALLGLAVSVLGLRRR
jgi:hypothetical protein